MVLRYVNRTTWVVDRAKLSKAEHLVDSILCSTTRSEAYKRNGHDGYEYAVVLPDDTYTAEERAFLRTLYIAAGWDAETEVDSDKRISLVLKV